MLIRDIFVSDVTRDIAPVVYLHEQSPEKLAAEVSEYIVTGGWPEGHPKHARVPRGIHEEYVRLLTNIAEELDKRGGPELPNAWISGFYGSGKSSFAKLLGLSLGGAALPDGGSLAEAWLQRDVSPKAAELRQAWQKLRQRIDPVAVVFDIGSVARSDDHIHTASVRQVQRQLGYCGTAPLVANFELGLERDGEWNRFETVAEQALGKPWAQVKDKSLVEDEFSLVMSRMFPELYPDPTSWFIGRGGTHKGADSPQEAVAAIRDMLKFRRPGATLFLVVDEVSQYVLSSQDRVNRLTAFATALGSTLKGKAWLLALGQQKLDEEADDSFLIWAKDRFPPKLRVHLAATNIRDVVHTRLLRKRPESEATLRTLFDSHRPGLAVYAYGCEDVTPEEFAETYPLLPGQMDLILQLTSALRARSARAQGDDQAIRGLLQVLGELFRGQKLAEQELGALVTLDQIYEVQHTALDSEVQASMARILNQCAGESDALLVRAAKAVALLELIQDIRPTDARLVAQCLYDRVDRGNQVAAVTDALEALRQRNLLGYSEKAGYKIQSTAAEEWEHERREFGVGREAISEIVRDGLERLLAEPDRPKLQGRPFPWAGVFSDGRRAVDARVVEARGDDPAVVVDFRFLPRDERDESTWVRRSAEEALRTRLVWVVGETDAVEDQARGLRRSQSMVAKYQGRRESLTQARKLLLQQEENRVEELEAQLRKAIAAAWFGGRLYFRGLPLTPQDHGGSFAVALTAAANRVLPELFTYFDAMQIQPAELAQLLEGAISGPSTKFLSGGLGILDVENGQFVASCTGAVVTRVREHIEAEGGLAGASLLVHFGGPPYGYTTGVVKACVVGLLRGGKVRVQPTGGAEITAIRDGGVRDVFEKERAFRSATIFPAGQDDIGPQTRARIAGFFETRLGRPTEREDHAIADAVAEQFPVLAQQLREVQGRLAQLPGAGQGPAEFGKLLVALEQCLSTVRQTNPTVKRVKKHLDALQDGVHTLKSYEAELTAEAIKGVRAADDVLTHQAAQLRDLGATTQVEAAADRIATHLQTERPWLGIGALDSDLETIRSAYQAERQRLLQSQEQQAEAARGRVRARAGFSTLTAEQSQSVMQPLARAVTDTTVEAVAPTLVSLDDPFVLALQRAEDTANEVLDTLLSERDNRLVTTVDLHLRNRELSSPEDVQALVDEIKERLLEQLQANTRVRLL